MPQPESPATPGQIDLALFAPYNPEVYLLPGWEQFERRPMQRGEDGWWRIRVELADGEYEYGFAVKSNSYFAQGEIVEVFDPYALSNTQSQPQRSLLTVRDGRRVSFEYAWAHDDVPLPQNDELVIYELHVGDFSGGLGDEPGATRAKHQFQDVIDKLDYLVDLGINCIELLPVKEFPGKQWGYSLRSLFAVEGNYGKPEDLCALIDACHGRGIRVVIDGVYNHADLEMPLAHMDYAYWFHEQNPDPPEMQWGPKWNYQHFDEKLRIYPARKYVCESIHFWVRHFHIDGIRFDATAAMEDFDTLRELVKAARDTIGAIKPFITIAEHVPEDVAIVESNGGPMTASWHVALAMQLQATITGHPHHDVQPWDFENLMRRMNPAENGYVTGSSTVNFITSHDDHQIMHQLGEVAKTFDEPAFKRAALGAVLLLTAPGLPMIWMGQEFGAAWEKTLEPRPLDWTLHQWENNQRLHQLYQKLIRARAENPALRGDALECILRDEGQRLLAYKRWNDAGNQVVVLINAGDEAREVEVSQRGLADGNWTDVLSGETIAVAGDILNAQVPANEARVYVLQG